MPAEEGVTVEMKEETDAGVRQAHIQLTGWAREALRLDLWGDVYGHMPDAR